ncbi:glycosyltransferase family 2 protein [uncultured Bacteroides sp.]|uniref:glycosyltransferase family 2 protein n=1 Tax=uncultured Bacteroides sp. TaxID=162156 RepID=UPI002AA6A38D|nr:glycosyltransferase family 2 protein [uncultured Bacteroides sp.]
MKVSIITATYNSAETVRDTIESVLQQNYKNIEYIIIDGGSKDSTLDIVKSYNGRIAKVVSESDKGIYDAMNKGIRLATGDIVGILNSDDFYTSNDVIPTIVEEFKKEKVDAVYGDIHFVSPDDLNTCVRYYSSKIFQPSYMRFGFMPAHPSFYVKRECYLKYGGYSLDYKISADFDLLVRFINKYKITCKYLPMDFVTMRRGGASTAGIRSKITLNEENIRACKKYGIYTNRTFMASRYLYKMFELRGLRRRMNLK